MDRSFTYRLKWIITGMIGWELVFWLLTAVVFWLMGYWSSDSVAGQLAFKFPVYLTYLLGVIPFIALYIWFLQWKNKRLENLASLELRHALTTPVSSYRVFLSFFMFRNTLVFLLFALAQPVFGTKKVAATMNNTELVLAIDISNSMNTKDVDPEVSRLEIVKRAMIQLINGFHGEKVGIVVFAGGAYMQLPLTADYGAAKMYVQEIETNMLSNQGTNIAAAFTVAQEMFSKKNVGKTIFLISDGENHEGGVDEALKSLKEQQISIAVLGIGTARGGLIPNYPGKPEMGYKTDQNGQTIVSRMNEKMLRQLAKKGEGFAIICTNSYPNLLNFNERLNQVKRTKTELFELDVKENWYQVPLFLALLSWLSAMVIYLLPFKTEE